MLLLGGYKKNQPLQLVLQREGELGHCYLQKLVFVLRTVNRRFLSTYSWVLLSFFQSFLQR